MWPSEEEEMEGQAQAYAAKCADDAEDLATEIMYALARPPSFWQARDLSEIEEIRQMLREVKRRIVAAGFDGGGK